MGRVSIVTLQECFNDGEAAALRDLAPGSYFRGATVAADNYKLTGSRRRAFIDGYLGQVTGPVTVDAQSYVIGPAKPRSR
jgi:hypothetical protein